MTGWKRRKFIDVLLRRGARLIKNEDNIRWLGRAFARERKGNVCLQILVKLGSRFLILLQSRCLARCGSISSKRGCYRHRHGNRQERPPPAQRRETNIALPNPVFSYVIPPAMIPAKSNCLANKLARLQRSGRWPWNATVTYVTRSITPTAYGLEQVPPWLNSVNERSCPMAIHEKAICNLGMLKS